MLRRRGEAVRLLRSKDPIEKLKAIKDYPELARLSIIINLVRAGIGDYNQVLQMEKLVGLEELQDIVAILAIIAQEEELDRIAKEQGGS